MTNEPEPKKVIFIGENSVSDAVRCKLPAVELAKMQYADVGYHAIDYRQNPPPPVPDADAVVFSRPHQDTLLMAYKRMGIPVIVDMDDDFHAIPESHPGYKFVGQGDPMYLMKLENCMYAADRLVVTTPELEERLSTYAEDPNEIKIIPNGWSSREAYWLHKRSTFQDRVIIGWGGTITHREDFQMCIQPIKKVLKEHPEAMVCIAGDPEIYRFFVSVPENQKLFIPMVPYDLYPITLSMWDIMLVPLLNNHFNRAKSDIKLVDAGARGIPYVASNMPVYWEWETGGTLADDDAWYGAIKRYVEDAELRSEHGKAGKKAAKSRDMLELGTLWRDVIEEVIRERQEEEIY